MRFFTILFLGIVSFITPVVSQPVYMYGNARYRDITLPYRYTEIVSRANCVCQPSLAIYLHGGTSRGSDNESQLSEPGIDSIYNYMNNNLADGAVLCVPQCPSGKSWSGGVLYAVRAMIDSLADEFDVDASRIYIFGGSMGGTGTWSMISTFPGLFAAAMPVAGNPSRCDVANVSQTPFFTVMGLSDNIMSIDDVNAFLSEMENYDAEYRMETEEGWTHEMTCIQSYTTERLAWVFSHPAEADVPDSTPTTGIATISQAPTIIAIRYFNIMGQQISIGNSRHTIAIRQTIYSDGRVETVKKLSCF